MSDSFENAIRLHEAGRLAEAARLFSDIVRANPRHFDAVYRLGAIQFQSGRFAEAEHLFAAATRIDASVPEAFYSRGCALQNLGRHEDALLSFARALAIRPDYLEARNNRGSSLLALHRPEEALAGFDKILAAKPGEAMVHVNRASALVRLRRFGEALSASEEGARRNPQDPEAWYQRGAALMGLLRTEDAARAFDRAIALKPDHAHALHYRGLAAAALGRHEDALAYYDKALTFSPGDADLLNNRANALLNLKRFEDAIAECEGVLRLDPEYKFVRGNLLDARLQICDWGHLDADRAEVASALKADKPVLQPLQSLLVFDDDASQLQCARIWAANVCPPAAPLWHGERYAHSRLRLVYVSANFRDHAVSQALAGVFEAHDRSHFDIYAVALDRPQPGAMRTRIAESVSRFIECGGRSDSEIAKLIRELEPDIAIDLMGHTEGAKPGIFAQKPAPVQVNYLGFPGTMGAATTDYIIADATIIPLDHQHHYAEAIIHLPDSYMPSDSARVPAPQTPSRITAGLPPDGFVFCSFNPAAKFNPAMFDVWMRLLRAVPDSVLWLSSLNPAALANLAREAQARGVSGDRILAAPFIADSREHLARLSLADLFLDTHPYNAHAGGVDALKAGVPIVTCTGSTFAGRVGTSLLMAAGLPELAATSLAEYEAIARAIAQGPERLAGLKARLAENHTTYPLFDTVGYTKHLEAAFLEMSERQRQGKPPASFAVSPLASS